MSVRVINKLHHLQGIKRFCSLRYVHIVRVHAEKTRRSAYCTASCESPRFQILHMVYFIQNVQKYRRYKFEIYVKISTGTTISQEMLKQTVNKNNIHVPVGVSQVSQLVVMILLINDCYVMSLVVIISRMNFVLY